MKKQHYFITNREIINKNGKEEVREDGREKAQDDIRFGYFDLDNENFKLYEDIDIKDSAIKLSYSDFTFDKKGSGLFFKTLYENMISKNGGDVLFFVHGFDTDLDGVRKNFINLNEKYVENENSPIKHIVIFTWPGKDLAIPLHYRNDAKDADRSGEALYRAFRKFQQFQVEFFKRKIDNKKHPMFCEKKIHLMCHSMGNRVLRAMLNEIKEENIHLEAVFNEITLMAANIEWHDLEPGMKMDQISELGERIHIYFNRSDNVLDIAKFTKRFCNQLGRYGTRRINKLASNIFQVDVTRIKDQDSNFERMMDHWYYYESNIVISDIIKVFEGDEISPFIGSENSTRKEIENRSYILLSS